MRGHMEAGQLLKEVSERYGNSYKENILEKRNPRNAGRKIQICNITIILHTQTSHINFSYVP